MTTITEAEAREKLGELIATANASHDPVTIVGKTGSAVLLSEGDWRAVQETLHLKSVPGLAEDIKRGMSEPVDECSDRLDW